MANALQAASYLQHSKSIYGHMHLQKLLYYCQGWALAWTGTPLFDDEIEAWRMGPVVSDVYTALNYGDLIDTEPLSAEALAIIDAVYRHYGADGGRALSVRTHMEEPWIEARGDLPATAPSKAHISRHTMRRFFTQVSMSGAPQPVQPVAISQERDSAVAITAARQRDRWREALDELALT